LRTAKQTRKYLADFLQGFGGERWSSDQDQIPAGEQIRQQWTHRLTQETLGPIPLHGSANRPTGCHPHTHPLCFTGLYYQHNKRVGIRLTCAPHPLEISRPGQAEFALHPYLEMPTVLVVSKH
jgi:hypothetical protein